jgi:proton-translocating NADH-quinone oxidoreductase chain L
MSPLETMLIWGVLCPLIGFVLLALFGARLGKPLSGYVACAGMGISVVLAIMVLARWWGMDAAARDAAAQAAFQHSFLWAGLGTIPLKIGVNLDSLTVIMFVMVTFVSFWIFVFSLGYMAGHSDEVDGQCKYHRFFTYLSLFGFSMLGLVIANSILFLFIFWELVGICSYLLIGFYFDKKFASDAAIKAFVTNRVGDFGFLIGLMLAVFYLHDLTLKGSAEAFAAQANQGTGLFAPGLSFLGVSAATWLGVCLFCGAIGKSAQVPLQVWLPDAMAGPTPVSALIHAATMVAAGVYLVARIFNLLTPAAQLVIATVGCITLALAALIAIVQTDIKKVLAFSTVSQLGYMIFGLGVGAWIGAMFHLLTHAFFKSLMFLGSGQVIEGCHHEQDIRKMGGLIRKMPVTAVTFLVGVIAIAGVGIPGVAIGAKHLKIGVGGFFSKDEILAVAYARTHAVPWRTDHQGGHEGDGHGEPPGAGHEDEHAFAPARSEAPRVIPASLAVQDRPRRAQERTPASTLEHLELAGDSALDADAIRQEYRAPWATAQYNNLPAWYFWIPIIIAYVTPLYMMRCWWLTFMGRPRDRHVYEHAHESPLMWIPLAVLAVGTFVASYVIFRPLVADAAPEGFLVPTVDGETGPGMHFVHGALVPIVGGAFAVGFAVAVAVYIRGLGAAERIKRSLAPLHAALERKLFFDDVYNWALVGGCRLVSRVAGLFDNYVVDLFVNLSARVTERLSSFSGWVLDARGIDGAVNGLADGAWNVAGALRRPQTGRIRNYVMFAAGGAAALLLIILTMR